MAQRLSPDEFLIRRDAGLALIDVRSPSEFADSHIPGACNIPLFSDAERESIGTIYKHTGKDEAILAGLDFVGKKLGDFVRQLAAHTREKEVLVYCWRGGMRSGAMSWLFEFAGYSCSLLDGGYKSYRSMQQEDFQTRANLLVLGGMTGSGKSEVLEEIEQRGEQIIHLEKIAHHKGSSFGAMGQAAQPSPAQFDNLLYEVWRKLDFRRIIFIEDESLAIGKVFIPQALYQQMRTAPLILLQLPVEERVKRIVREYANFPDEELKNAMIRISKRLGNDQLKAAIEAIDAQDYEEATRLSLNYYDKAYRKGNEKRDLTKSHPLVCEKDYPKENAGKIIALVYNQLNTI
jgi:tRNA 2-selenouridine synthase